MKQFVFAIATLALMLGGAAVQAEDTTITGEAVDISCYLGGNSGEAHASCAAACAEKGQPIGLLVTEGDEKQVYLVLGQGGKSAKDLMLPHMGKQVEVTGTVADKDGMKAIRVAEVKGPSDDWMPDDVAGSGSINN